MCGTVFVCATETRMPDEAHARKWVLLATHAFEANPLEEHYAGLLAAAVRATALRFDG